MSKILIAGGTGFVGQNTAKLYADSGIPVVVTTRKENDPVAQKLREYSDLISIAKVDLSREEETASLFAEHQFEGMIMLAQTHQHASSRKEINAIYPIVLNCLEHARESGVKRVVLGSSVVVYGGEVPPFTEETPFHQKLEFTDETPLQITRFEIRVKRIVEQMFMDYSVPLDAATSASGDAPSKQNELEVAILRFPIQFGPGYSYAGNPVALACHAAAGKVDDLVNKIGYMNLPVPDLWNVCGILRPLYVKDTASALKTVMSAETLPGVIYNLTSGFSNSPRKQFEAVLAAAPDAKDSLNIPLEALSTEEVEHGFNSQRMFEDFGWKSGYTLESACKDYIDHLADNDV